MKTDLPPLNWVKTFEAAARLLNFSAAARELHMTQPAVSQQVKLLEHHLGDELFTRHHRKITLTNRGLAYLPVVQATLNNLQRKTADIFSPAGKQRLMIRVNYAFSSLWLSNNLNKFCANYSGIELQLAHANWDVDFAGSNHDLAIMNGNGQWPNLSLEPLITAEVQPYCSSQIAPLISSPMDLLSTSLIEVVGTSYSWEQWFEKVGIDLAAHNVTCHKVDTMLSAMLIVESGLGAMLGFPDLFAKQYLKRQLISPFDIRIETEDNYFLAFPKGKPLSKSATVFQDWLLKEMAELKDSAP